jgi:hypothetical protein
MVDGTVISHCDCSSHRPSNYLLWLQGAGRYLRAFDGCWSFLRPYDWNHGTGFA